MTATFWLPEHSFPIGPIKHKGFPGAPSRWSTVSINEYCHLQTEIIELSESRLRNKGSSVENNYTFFSSGQPTGSPRYREVGIVVDEIHNRSLNVVTTEQ